MILYSRSFGERKLYILNFSWKSSRNYVYINFFDQLLEDIFKECSGVNFYICFLHFYFLEMVSILSRIYFCTKSNYGLLFNYTICIFRKFFVKILVTWNLMKIFPSGLDSPSERRWVPLSSFEYGRLTSLKLVQSGCKKKYFPKNPCGVPCLTACSGWWTEIHCCQPLWTWVRRRLHA